MIYSQLFVLSVILFAGWWVEPLQIETVSLCYFKFLTGYDCPGCGLTRSFLSMSRFHAIEAIQFNAAGPLLYICFFVYYLNLIFDLLKLNFKMMIPVTMVGVCGICLVVLLLGHFAFKFFSTVF